MLLSRAYQSWDLDGTGNWLTSTTGSTTDTKTFNESNETETTTVSITPTYDTADQLTQFVDGIDGTKNYTYDDTGQLTLVTDQSQQTVESYQYGTKAEQSVRTKGEQRWENKGVRNHCFLCHLHFDPGIGS